MKRILSACLVILMITAMIIPVFSAEKENVQPLYNNIAGITVGLRIDESTGTAYASGSVDAYYHVPVEVLVQLQVYKDGQWKTLMTWSDADVGIAAASGQWAVESGYNYRARVTGYICNDLGIPVESETETREQFYPAS